MLSSILPGCAWLTPGLLPGDAHEVTQALAAGPLSASGSKLRSWTMMDGGGNSMLLETRGALLLVDDKWLLGITRLVQQVQAVTLETGKPVQALIETHPHPDHTAGRKRFPESLIIHAFDDDAGSRERIVESSCETVIDGETVDLFVFRAHTGADIVAYFPQRKLLAAGDLLVTDGLGHVEGFLCGAWEGSWLQMRAALLLLKEYLPADVAILSGHRGRSRFAAPGRDDGLNGIELLERKLAWLDAAVAAFETGNPPLDKLEEDLARRFGLFDMSPLVTASCALADLRKEVRGVGCSLPRPPSPPALPLRRCNQARARRW